MAGSNADVTISPGAAPAGETPAQKEERLKKFRLDWGFSTAGELPPLADATDKLIRGVALSAALRLRASRGRAASFLDTPSQALSGFGMGSVATTGAPLQGFSLLGSP